MAEHQAAGTVAAAAEPSELAVPSVLARAALDKGAAYASQAHATATLRAYRADWQDFRDWCLARAFTPLPAEPAVIGAYLAEQAECRAANTVRRRVSAIGMAHRYAGLPWDPAHPAIRDPLRGALKVHGRPAVPAIALTVAMLRDLVATCDLSPRGRRDRALLLIGFAGAFRRSELVSLRIEAVVEREHGLVITLPRSKTDQQGSGAEIGLAPGQHAATCPVRALRLWRNLFRDGSGPLFRRVLRGGQLTAEPLVPSRVSRILVGRARQAALPEEVVAALSAHALRVGFITEAYQHGVPDADIMAHTRHRDLRTMRGYVRRAGLVTESPTARLGL